MPQIYHNATIHTLRAGSVSAMAVDGERIVALGTLRSLSVLYPGAERIDLKGYTVVPGFNDSHCHLLGTGMNMLNLDLRGVHSFKEIVERGHDYIKKNQMRPGDWVVGDGFDQNVMQEGALPDKTVADAITTEYPVLIERVCGHVGTLNSRAIEIMGVTSNSQIDGGAFDRSVCGELNGIVRETALSLARARVPVPGEEKLAQALRLGMEKFNRYGVTSVQSDDLEGIGFDAFMNAISLLREKRKMTLRINEEMQAPDVAALRALIARGLSTGMGDDWMRIGNIKLIADGSLGARTAYLKKDYLDDGQCGIRIYSDATLTELARMAHDANLQIAFHAIGDGAAEQCIRSVEVAQAHEWKPLYHRIVHGQVLSEKLIDRIARLGMAVDIQPAFVATDWPLVVPLLGTARSRYSYAWSSLLRRGIPLGAGSDSPVEECDPLFGIYCAVTRKDTNGNPENGFMPKECLTAYEALELYTIGGAKLSLEEDKKGSLVPGMLADFAVLSEDILSVDAENIRSIEVLATVVGGDAMLWNI